MKKQTIITAMFVLASMAGQGQELQAGKPRIGLKCHVEGTVAEGTQAVELVICRRGMSEKDNPLHLTVNEGRFACDMEDSNVECYEIVDYGELKEKGSTTRTEMFYVEDGANVTVRLDGDKFDVKSTGEEYGKWTAMKHDEEGKISKMLETLDMNDEAAMARAEAEIRQWTFDYYVAHPMLGFLFELENKLRTFHFNDVSLGSMLDIYHRYYTTLYAGHPVHQRIAEYEDKGFQICGRKYNDYDVRTMEGAKVRASDYFKGHMTLVICWASWCAPCIREANDVIPVYQQYHGRGLHAFSLAHESKSTDAMRKVVERNAYPWPCLVDVDDEFQVFMRHGTYNSALFLIDEGGTIIAVMNNVDELKAKLKEIYGD